MADTDLHKKKTARSLPPGGFPQ